VLPSFIYFGCNDGEFVPKVELCSLGRNGICPQGRGGENVHKEARACWFHPASANWVKQSLSTWKMFIGALEKNAKEIKFCK
jgi:hypothetical protein